MRWIASQRVALSSIAASRTSSSASTSPAASASTWAAIHAAVQRQRRDGHKLAWIHLMHLNPLPNDLGEKLKRYPKVLVPELNRGQLCSIVRGKYLVDAKSVTRIQGTPFTAGGLEQAILDHFGGLIA